MESESSKMLKSQFLSAIEDYNMLSTSSIAVGFSGGADSSLLLYLLREECRKRNISLFAIHINHMIRRGESDRDEDFCKTVCKEYGIPFYIRKIDVPALAKASSKGLEEAARDARYQAFSEICRENGIETVATAHNSDDNAETILFSLSRGASPKGLCGIPPKRDNIIRPLIYIAKSDIVAFCKENEIEFVTDSTNGNDEYSRNFIRHEILPKIKQLNPNVLSSFTHLSKLEREDEECLDELSKKLENMNFSERIAQNDAILSRYLIKQYRKFGNSNLSFSNVKALTDFYRNAERSCRLSLPGKIDCVKLSDGIAFEESRKEKCGFEKELSENENIISDWRITKSTNPDSESTKNAKKQKNGINVYKNSIFACFSSDTIKGKLKVRTRKDGDAIFFNNHTHRLKKLLNESTLTLSQRDSLPIVCDDEGIILVPGIAQRQGSESKQDSEETTVTVTIEYIGNEK